MTDLGRLAVDVQVSNLAAGLHLFVAESNRIEGIDRRPRPYEVDAHAVFLSLQTITLDDFEKFVDTIASAELRRAGYMNVRVGAYRPPPGGPHIERDLRELLDLANSGRWSPYDIHREYEALHPFMDGNGRSGRALWAWMMRRNGDDPFTLPFLHRWYYQSLDEARP